MIVSANSLVKRFGKTVALNGISLEIRQGEIFGLVGPDGAGKTTFIRTLLGLYEADSGSSRLFGQARPESVKDRIGYVPQQFSLSQDLTVWENLRLFGSLYGISGNLFAERAQELLQMVWMEKFKDRFAGDLSGGMKQKLALAAGLLHRPELLILDEPTTGVDPVSRREFWQLLYRLNQRGLTLIVSTPYMDEVELCHRLAFFHQGQIKIVGAPAALLAQYPYRLFGLHAENLRHYLTDLQKLPAQDVYLQGETLHIVLKSDQDSLEPIKAAIQALGLTDYQLAPLSPTLEDLFSVLSARVEVPSDDCY